MKKFILPLLGSVTLLSGCFKTPESNSSPIAGGIEIYRTAAVQNNLSMEPANVAFRLYTLLGEARDQGITDLSSTSLNSIKVSFKGSTGPLRTLLFGDPFSYGSTITQDIANPNLWTITYPIYYGDNPSPYDLYYKTGSVYIDTGGKLLDEDGASWTVTTFDANSKSDLHVYIGSSYEVFLSTGACTVTNVGENRWHIYDNNLLSYDVNNSSNNQAEWQIDFTVRATPADPAASTFARMSGAVFALSGSGSGGSFAMDVNVYGYTFGISDTAPLLYKMCDNSTKPTIFGGAVQCQLMDLAGVLTTSGNYPSMSVDVTWSEPSPCSPSMRIDYNGNSQTF